MSGCIRAVVLSLWQPGTAGTPTAHPSKLRGLLLEERNRPSRRRPSGPPRRSMGLLSLIAPVLGNLLAERQGSSARHNGARKTKGIAHRVENGENDRFEERQSPASNGAGAVPTEDERERRNLGGGFIPRDGRATRTPGTGASKRAVTASRTPAQWTSGNPFLDPVVTTLGARNASHEGPRAGTDQGPKEPPAACASRARIAGSFAFFDSHRSSSR